MSERRVDVIVRWLEEHPEVKEKLAKSIDEIRTRFPALAQATSAVISKMREFGKTFQQINFRTAEGATSLAELSDRMQRALISVGSLDARYVDFVKTAQIAMRELRKSGLSTDELRIAMSRLNEIAKEVAQSIGEKEAPALLLTNEILNRQLRGIQSVSQRMERWSRRINILGWRLSWMAYRLMMMGRIITRWMLRPVNFAINALTRWERSLDTVATSMGLLAATGQLTGERQEFLQRTMDALIEEGPKIQGAFQYVQSAMIGLVTQAGEPLSQFFFALGDMIASLAPIIESAVIPALTELVKIFIQWLPTIKEIIELALPPFIEGLKEIGPLLLGFLNWIKPLIPFLARLAGMFAPFAMLLTGIGMALYFITPALQLFSGLLGGLPKIFSFVKDHIGAFRTALSFLRGGFGKVVGFITGPLKSAFGTLVGVFSKVGSFIGSVLTKAISGLGSMFSFLAAHPIALVIIAIGALIGILIYLYNTNEDFRNAVDNAWNTIRSTILSAIEAIQGAFKSFLDWIDGLRKGFTDFVSGITRLFGGVTQQTEEFKKSQEELGETIEDMYGHSIGRVIARDLSYAIDSVQEAQRVFSRANLGITGGVGVGVPGATTATQYINISAPITIESISSELDLDTVRDAVTDALSDAIRRVRR